MSARAERALFISDLHLEEARPDITRAFLGFLEDTATRADTLYILGDFFNLWIGDDHVSELTRTVSTGLARLAANGTDVCLMHGNRDFLLGSDFARGCQARLLDDPHVLTLHGQRYLLTHGDRLCTRDVEYQDFRRMVRDDGWQQQFLAQPLQQRQIIADQIRSRSKAMASNKAEDIMDVTQDEVERMMGEHEVSTLIHGHTHRPAVHEFNLGDSAARRIVLGDWHDKGWYLRIDQDGEALENFAFSTPAVKLT